MLDGLLAELLQVKWQTWARKQFNTWLFLFAACLFVASIAYITRFERNQTPIGSNSKSSPAQLLNSISEKVLVCCVVAYLVLLTKRSREAISQSERLHLSLLGSVRRTLAQAPELALFTCTCFLILICVPLRLTNLSWTENLLAALIMFMLPLTLLFFCRASRSLGPFIVMIYKIIVNDVLCFVVFLIIFVAGFSQSFQIIFKTHLVEGRKQVGQLQTNSSATTTDNSAQNQNKNYFENPFDAVISMHMMALNEFTLVFDEFDSTSYPNLARLLFCVYMVLASILLINMLIAMLGKTYQEIASQPNESLRQWARALMTVERLCSQRRRLQTLDMYSHCNNNNVSSENSPARFYNSTWSLNADDLKKIGEVKRLKAENKLRAEKLKKNNLILPK